MTPTSPAAAVHYDPYDVDIDDDPYPTWRRLRDESPLYRNEELNVDPGLGLTAQARVQITTRARKGVQ